jgi:choline kinase
MHGLILAGGEGSRLAADGVGGPKAAVAIGGRPQILRLVETLASLGCTSITCMVRDAAADAFQALDGALASGSGRAVPLRVLPCHTPSSLHTLVDGLTSVPRGDVFCTMVDTVMRGRDWRDCYQAAGTALADGADAVLAVTPFVDDEHPLWVHRDAQGFVRLIGDTPAAPPCVTGGVYAFGPRARREAHQARRDGASRMRGFLAQLVADGHRVATVEVPRIVDVDRRHDLDFANAWLGGEETE